MTQTKRPWACPWGICPQDAAQTCRANKKDGCGARFPGMSYEMARAEVNRPRYAPPVPGPQAAGATPLTQLTEERVREIVRDELAKHASGVPAPTSTDREPSE